MENPTTETIDTGIKVMMTTDYKKFTYIGGNRIVGDGHMKKLSQSILKTGTNVQPIIVNTKFELIDGQHRLGGCQEAGMPVSYIVMDLPMTKEALMIELNINSKNWTGKDYLEHGVAKGVLGYKEIHDMQEKYQIGIEAVNRLCGVSSSHIRNQEEVKVPMRLEMMAQAVSDFRAEYYAITNNKMRKTLIAVAIADIEIDLHDRVTRGDSLSIDVWSYKEAIAKLSSQIKERGISDAPDVIKASLSKAFDYKKDRKNKLKI